MNTYGIGIPAPGGNSSCGLLSYEAGFIEFAKKADEIRVPSNMIAIGDASSHTSTLPGPTGEYQSGGWGKFSVIYRHLFSRDWQTGTVHNQGGNMVFLDGHVEWQHWLKWIEFSDAAARRWNYDNQPHDELWATNSP